MQPQIVHKLPSKLALLPRLPGDILHLVSYFSSFETRANLVQCNKWLHETCTPLLFKDIYLHAPEQLIELCDNEGAMRMLNRTDSIHIGERLFSCPSWPSQAVEDAPDLLIRVLSATNSLTRLQVHSSDRLLEADYDFDYKFQKRLDSAASNPSFLPNLAILIEHPDLISLGALCHNRPIIYHYHQVDPYMRVDICPGSKEGGSGPNPKHNLTAHDIGVLIRKSQWTSPNVYKCVPSSISIRMRFPEEIKHGSQSPVQDPLTWVKTMLLASKTPFDKLHSLDIKFEPNPPYQSAAVQLAAVEELYEDYPELEDVTISYPQLHWSRSVNHPGYESDFFPEDPLPDWTPYPAEERMPHWIDWWLNALHLRTPDAQSLLHLRALDAHSLEDLSITSRMLRNGIRFRWESDYINLASSGAMFEYLRNRLRNSLTAS